MSLTHFQGLIYFTLGLLLFLLVQRWLHRELQSIFLLITRNPAVSVGLFSIIFFPGVLLHELSHLVVAWILRVPVMRISLIPHVLDDGNLRMGYVETGAADVVRESLIGAAPLITGSVVVTYIGINRMGLAPQVSQVLQLSWIEWAENLANVPAIEDFWLWFYLAFSVSSTMLPSSTDRRAWLPIGLVIVLMTGLALAAGAGPWLLENAAPVIDMGFRTLGLIFAASILLHIILAIPAFLIRTLISRITGLRVV